MSKFLRASIGWLAMMSASIGFSGQHTGVGGNPIPPPPADPNTNGAPALVLPSITGFGIPVMPDITVEQPTTQAPQDPRKPGQDAEIPD